MFRKIFLSALLASLQLCSAQNKYEKDFVEFWTDFKNNYAYFDVQKVDWDKVKEIYFPFVKDIQNDEQFIQLLEQVTHELYNGHVTLNVSLYTSNRIIPSGQDIFVEKIGERYFVSDVRKNSAAAAAGIEPGVEIGSLNGKTIESQIFKFLPKHTTAYTAEMYSYAVNMLLAGTWDKPRAITIRKNGQELTLIPKDSINSKTQSSLLDIRILDDNIGYIRINNSLGQYSLIAEFDAALDKLINTKSIILDLTDTPGGGNTTVARGIMGRFTDKPLPYQKHRIEENDYGTVRNWIEYVSPRKSIYKNKLIVMVGHWTGSMGEGMAIGFDGMKRAKITGTRMAGLLGAIYTYQTENTKIGYQIPAESMYHINGTPREKYLPKYLTRTESETYTKAIKLAK